MTGARFFNSFESLISFFQQHRSQRGIGLLAVPRATAGRSKSIHQDNQVSECSRHVSSLPFSSQEQERFARRGSRMLTSLKPVIRQIADALTRYVADAPRCEETI